MPEKFLDQMARTHNTKPFMNGRRIDRKNFDQSVVNGIGIVSGFQVAVTTPVSKKVQVTQGLATGPDGEQIRVGIDVNLSEQDYRKALFLDSALADISLLLESLSGAYATLDPVTHSVLLTLDINSDRIRALKITNAEKTAIDAAITASENVDANPEFEPATADHRARLRGSFKNPDGFAGATGVIAGVNAATEFVLATLTLGAVGGNITVVTMRRERKIAWASLIVP